MVSALCTPNALVSRFNFHLPKPIREKYYILKDASLNMNLEADKFREFLGIEVLEVREGYARVKGVVGENNLNFHRTAHGSYIMALADAAFALAANSDGRERVALSIKVDFYKPAFEGEELIGEAEATKKGRIMFCDLRITRNGELIAKGDAIAVAVEK